jgi:hypothetical protein
MELDHYNQAIDFQEKATASYLEKSPYRKAWSAKGQAVYRKELSYHYRSLARLEQLNAMALHLGENDHQARVVAKRAVFNVTNAILLHQHHESYAIRASVAAYSCNPKDARADIQYAIKLAKRSGDERAAKEYASINPDDCWWGEDRSKY